MSPPTCQGLGQRHHVGLDAEVLVSPQLARAPEAALHLVEDEHGPCLVTQLPQPLQELGGGGVDAALALQGFHDNAGRLPLQPDAKDTITVCCASREEPSEADAAQSHTVMPTVSIRSRMNCGVGDPYPLLSCCLLLDFLKCPYQRYAALLLPP